MLKAENITKVSRALIEKEANYDPWAKSIVPVFVNKDLLKWNHTHSFIHPLLLHPTMAEVSSWDRDCAAYKVYKKYFLPGRLQNKFACLCFIYLFTFKIDLFLYSSVFGCAGSLLLWVGLLWWMGAALCCSVWPSHHCGFSCCGTWALGLQASAVVARGLRCPTACGILPGQGSKPCPLHWQLDS